MKRNLLIIVIGTLFVLATGCANGDSQEATQEATQEDNVATVQTENKEPQKENDPKDMKRADALGKVTRIVGNEVTLDLIEMPEVSEENKSEGNGQERMKQGNGGVEPTFTGETKQVVIPVGIPILTRSKTGQEELDLSDIVSGSMIMLWMDENETPYRVQVMGAR